MLDFIKNRFLQHTCNHFESLISDSMDNFATPHDLTDLDKHIESCKSCRDFLAIAESSRQTLQSRPKLEVPSELSLRLVNALAAEREAEMRRSSKGGGIGTPTGYRLGWAMPTAAVALCSALVFGLIWSGHNAHSPISAVITKPVLSSKSNVVASLPAHKTITHPTHFTPQAPLTIASSNISTAPSSHSEFVSQRASSWSKVQIDNETIASSNLKTKPTHSELVQLASQPKPSQHIVPKSTLAPSMTIASNTAQPKLSTGAVAAPPPESIPVVQPKPIEVASAANTQPIPDIVVEPTASEIQHTHLTNIFHEIARQTHRSGEASLALTTMNARISYSDSVSLVGSEVH